MFGICMLPFLPDRGRVRPPMPLDLPLVIPCATTGPLTRPSAGSAAMRAGGEGGGSQQATATGSSRHNFTKLGPPSSSARCNNALQHRLRRQGLGRLPLCPSPLWPPCDHIATAVICHTHPALGVASSGQHRLLVCMPQRRRNVTHLRSAPSAWPPGRTGCNSRPKRPPRAYTAACWSCSAV